MTTTMRKMKAGNRCCKILKARELKWFPVHSLWPLYTATQLETDCVLIAQSFSPFSSRDGRQVRRPDPTRVTSLFSKI
jgi:hypothetical protein